MADTVICVAGLAAGVVSLGLQVTGGITSYLDAIKGRQEEITSVKRDLDRIVSTLHRLRDIFSQPRAKHLTDANLQHHIVTCLVDLVGFGDIPECITFVNQWSQSNTHSLDGEFFQKLKNAQGQVMYPLKHRSKVQKLESRLHKLQESLQTSLQKAMLQSQQLQDIVTAIKEVAQKTRLENIIEEHGLLSSSTGSDSLAPPDLMVGRLVSKPGSLECIARESQLYEKLVSCTCPVQKTRRYTQNQWWSTTFFTRTENTKHHLPGCKLSLTISDESSQTCGVTFAGLPKIIRKAVQVSITLNTQGVGAARISPTIRYHAIINGPQAPAFRLISVLQKYTICAGISRLRDSLPDSSLHFSLLVHHCFSEMLELFHQGKGSPTDVNEKHRSLVWLVTYMHATAIPCSKRYSLVMRNVWQICCHITQPTLKAS
ncbi:hypothetical protein PG984_005006 [Apiospora sp. TS-2023a]